MAKHSCYTPLLGALAVCAALSPLPASAVLDNLVREALTLADAGKGRQAYDMLEPHEAARAGDPEFDTVFGIAANLAGEHPRAILALERVLLVQPRNARARAEMGRAMFAVGDAKSARTFLDQAKSEGAPPEVSSNIDQLLRAIERVEAEGQSSVRGHVEVMLGTDSNVATGPASNTVAVPLLGGNFVLNPANVKQSATYLGLTAGVNGRYVIDSRLSVIGGANLGWRNHPSKTNFDNTQLGFSGGLSYRANKDEYTAVLTHDDYWVSGSVVREQNGLVAEWSNRSSETSQFGAYLQYSKLHYPGQKPRDVNRTVLGGSYAQQLTADLVGYAGLYGGEERAASSGVPENGHKLYGLRVGGQITVNPQWTGFVGMTYEHRRYGGPHPTFGVVRSDDQSSLSLGANWSGFKDWRVTPQISYTRIKSNIVLNDYDRTLVSVTARHDF